MIIIKTLERSYSYVFKGILRAANPIKKRIMKTECIVHKFINNQAVAILKNDGYTEVCKFMNSYIRNINAGVVWADQDLKSSNHFYNPHENKGLYGSSNAKKECITYYIRALDEYAHNRIKNAMFYLGVACHLIQDLTVPQHANVRLLNEHKSFENWVVRSHMQYNEFKLEKGGIYFDSLEGYINFNSKEAINIHKKHSHVKNKHVRFKAITSMVLTMAQATTAGLMLKFYKDMQDSKPITITEQREHSNYISIKNKAKL